MCIPLCQSTRFVRLAGAGWLLAVVSCWASRADAHPPLVDYIEHQITIQLDHSYIDIHVELTFHDIRSLLERRRMDADRDGLVSREEIAAYLGERMADLEDGLLLTFGGRQLDLVLLYDPVLDLCGNRGAMGTRHSIRMTLFARTPASLTSGELQLHDRLWPAAAASCLVSVRGSADIHLRATSVQEIWLPGPDAPPRVLILSIHSVPAVTPAITSLQHLETHHALTTRPGHLADMRPGQPASRPAGR